ncbi:MAG: PIG-L deacetylase family protein [Acidimicrobiales bacterium]
MESRRGRRLSSHAGEPPRRALVVTAHPDDVDFGAAGTVATWVASGTEVVYCVVTDGDAGGSDPVVARRDMAEIRRSEQRAAAAELGVTELRFLGYPDGRLTASLELRRDLARTIRELRPQRVLTHTPVRNLDSVQASHPDHLAVGEATMCAVYPDARNPFAHPELAGLEPHAVGEVWLMGVPEPNRVLDVTDLLSKKLAALRRHSSQLPDPGGPLEAMLRRWMGATASGGGLPEGRLAEAFREVQIL